MRNLATSLQRLDDQMLLAVRGGMPPKLVNPYTLPFKTTQLHAPGSHDMPGGVRDQQRAAAQAQFNAMTKAVPLSVALPSSSQAQAQFLHRVATGYGQPQLRKGK